MNILPLFFSFLLSLAIAFSFAFHRHLDEMQWGLAFMRWTKKVDLKRKQSVQTKWKYLTTVDKKRKPPCSQRLSIDAPGVEKLLYSLYAPLFAAAEIEIAPFLTHLREGLKKAKGFETVSFPEEKERLLYYELLKGSFPSLLTRKGTKCCIAHAPAAIIQGLLGEEKKERSPEELMLRLGEDAPFFEITHPKEL